MMDVYTTRSMKPPASAVLELIKLTIKFVLPALIAAFASYELGVYQQRLGYDEIKTQLDIGEKERDALRSRVDYLTGQVDALKSIVAHGEGTAAMALAKPPPALRPLLRKPMPEFNDLGSAAK